MKHWLHPIRLMVCVAFAFVLSGLFGGHVNASAGPGYTLAPVYPDNQIGGASGAFDLLVKPGSTQPVSIKVVNSEDKKRTIRFVLNTAYTNDVGNLMYNRGGKYLPKDSTRKFSIGDFPKVQIQDVVFQPKQTGYVNFKLDIPNQQWQGVLLGGVMAVPLNEQSNTVTQKGTILHNEYGLTLPITLRTNAKAPNQIKLRLNTIRPGKLIDNTIGVAINVQNTNAGFTSGQLAISAKIYRKGSKTVLHQQSVKNTSFAPNSNYNFGVSWKNQPLQPGKYHLSWKSNIGGVQNWNFERDFTISNADAQRLNNEAGFKPNYLWLWILLAVLFVALLMIIVYYFGRKRSRQSSNSSTGTGKRRSR